MGRIEKTVFISYRRTNFPWAFCIYQDLTHHGYDVFFDYQNIDSGSFEKTIIENIRARAHFVVVLSPSALEKCNQPGDWLRREIETAMDEKRNIIPVMLEGFDFGSPSVKSALTGKLASLNGYNGMNLVAEYVEAGFDKLRNRFLSVALEDVQLHPLTAEVKAANETQKTAASEAPQVEKEELTAQEWFERGYVFQNDKKLDEAIRCYTEAIRLGPDFLEAYGNRGNAYSDIGNMDAAFTDYNKVLEIDPNDAKTYFNLGLLLHENLKRYDEAEAAYRKAIELNPSDDKAHSNLGILLRNLKRYDEAEAAYRKAIELNPSLA
ncbi:MAG: tetratricopeptide repeat protein, partial [Chloroflexi bacterium]|nr:tetratricopeptide repeat protein [Chloroflexota bacterium]